MTRYSEVVKEENRFIGTDSKTKYKNWIRILDDNFIRYKELDFVKLSEDRLLYRIELVGYSKEENKRIVNLVNLNFNEEEGE